jgi:phenylacetate-CoA ligase
VRDAWLRVYSRLPTAGRSLAASLYGLYLRRWRYGPDTPQLVEEALERDRWSPERWRSWCEGRLGYVLHRAATRVPYYREQWAARRRRGDRASWECLENWPILDKQTLRTNPVAFVADDCDIRHMYPEHTSGTTGTPLRVWWGRRTVRAWFALFEARARRWSGTSRRDHWAILGGQPVVPAQTSRPPFWVWNAALRQLYVSTGHISRRNALACVDALARYRVTHVLAYPSAAAVLAQGAARHRVQLPALKVVIANAEPVYPWQREIIEAGLECPVRETYGMAEIGAAASQCAQNTIHLWPEVGHLEVIEDTADVAVKAGTPGRFVCTGLLNADMPLVRYALGDRGVLGTGEACRCGRTLPALSSIEGRTNDALLTPDGRTVYWINPIFYGLPVVEAQVIQESLDRVRIRFVPDAGFTEAHSQQAVERLRTRMGPVAVRLDRVDAIPRASNGKFRAVICNISDQPELSGVVQ